MSWREIIPELSILLFLTDLLNKIGLSLSNAKTQKESLDEELVDIERELEDLKKRTSSEFQTLTEKKQKETLNTQNTDDEDIQSKIDNLSKNLEERKLDGQELNYVIIRRAELIKRKGEIIAIELPRVTLLERIAEARFSNTEQLLPRLKNIQTSIDNILTTLDSLIQSISAIPVTGPPLASILTTILSIIEQKIYLPLKVALVLWEQSLNSLRLVFFKEEN